MENVDHYTRKPTTPTKPRYVLCCLWDGAYKRSHAANRAGNPYSFLSGYTCGPLPYVRLHITVNKMC